MTAPHTSNTQQVRNWRKLFIGLCASALLSLGHERALGDEVSQFKLSLWVPGSHPLVKSAREWAASIEQASNGTIKFTVFPSEQLGKAIDHYDMARDGIADVAYVATSYQPGRFPIIGLTQIPFLVANGTTGSAAVDTWYRTYQQGELKGVHFCLAFVQDPGSFHSSKKKILAPSDVRSLRVRPSGAVVAELVTTLGGTNVQSSAPEARDILARGTADAITFPWGSVFLFGIDKVTKYHLDAPLYTAPFVWVFNQAKYDALTPGQKQVIDNHCTTQWAERLATPWAQFEAAGRVQMRAAPGHEVDTLDPAQLEQWRNAAAPLMQSWATSVRNLGLDPDRVVSAAQITA